ncbi:MAG: DNA-formamidopyrimidine glycosylase family protein [bacterium]
MPELPDVEIFKKYFDSTSLHQKIKNVDIKEIAMLGEVSPRSLQVRLKEQQFISTLRQGKYLFAKTDDEKWLVLHFGMTGFLKYFKNPDESPEHIRLLIDFDNKYHLAYDCQRKLGLIDLINDVHTFIRKKELGIDPYREKFDFEQFKKIVKGKRSTVKSVLMDQSLLAGIGNIYSDEISFQAKIHPGSRMKKLSDRDLKIIYERMKDVLQTAIDKEADPDQLPDTYLIPYRNPGDSCPICNGTIQKKTISGRSSYFCTKHQKLIQ